MLQVQVDRNIAGSFPLVSEHYKAHVLRPTYLVYGLGWVFFILAPNHTAAVALHSSAEDSYSGALASACEVASLFAGTAGISTLGRV